MSPIITLVGRLLIIVAVTGPAVGQGRLEGRGTARRFVSDKYGFSIAVPPGWLVDPSRDTPVYYGFPASEVDEFNRELKIPKGGAIISIASQETLGRSKFSTLTEWAVKDARGDSSGSPAIAPFEMRPDTGVRSAIISTYDGAFGPDNQMQHRMSVFWETREGAFVAHLSYVADDSKGPAFERLFLDVVRSIRPLSKPNH